MISAVQRDSVHCVAVTSQDRTIGAIDADDVNARRRPDDIEKAVSRRWADLVDHWVP